MLNDKNVINVQIIFIQCLTALSLFLNKCLRVTKVFLDWSFQTLRAQYFCDFNRFSISCRMFSRGFLPIIWGCSLWWHQHQLRYDGLLQLCCPRNLYKIYFKRSRLPFRERRFNTLRQGVSIVGSD